MYMSNNSHLLELGGVFLLGFMGSGKSHWGKIWAQQSDLPFYDLDGVIEQQNVQTITQIFEQDGEAFFRHIEAETLRYFENKQPFILSCGGGTPCFEQNMQWMNDNGITIYLRATPQQIFNRLISEKEKRPIIKNTPDKELLDFIEKKLAEREKFYKQAQHTLLVDELHEQTITQFLKSK
jgi:shikimate kinase